MARKKKEIKETKEFDPFSVPQPPADVMFFDTSGNVKLVTVHCIRDIMNLIGARGFIPEPVFVWYVLDAPYERDRVLDGRPTKANSAIASQYIGPVVISGENATDETSKETFKIQPVPQHYVELFEDELK